MEDKEFLECDWKRFREDIPGWQENYMNKLNQEYIQILMKDDLSSRKFWEIDKRIKEDKKSPGVLIDMRRSRLIFNIVMLIRDGVIERSDLDGYSDVLKDTIDYWLKR